MRIGEPVEVYTAFVDSWQPGFEIAEVRDDGYQVRRQSDGSLLPAPTSDADVRPLSTRGTAAGSHRRTVRSPT